MPELKWFANLWTLRGHLKGQPEWSLRRKIAEAKEAKFDAIGGKFEDEALRLCSEFDLGYVLYIDADSGNYRELLDRAAEWRPRRVNVQLCDDGTPPKVAAETWLAMTECAGQLGLEIDLELHRNTATETPEKAEEIAALFAAATGRTIRFSLDFSHFAVTKHLAPPFAPRLLEHREWVVAARQMHFRPFNGHHAQVPATDGSGGLTPEFVTYLEFVEALMAGWLETAGADDVIYACPENGPMAGGYALSCFPDVWDDAVVVRDHVAAIWQKCLNRGLK